MAAGPAVEQIWQEFRGAPFQAFAIEMWQNSSSFARAYIENTGVTFPVLWGGGYLQSNASYGIRYDNYIVIDPAGVIRYTSVGEAFGEIGRFSAASIRAAIGAHLPTPVTALTWSRVKSLYAAP